MQFKVDLLGEQFTVFDIEMSHTVPFLKDDFTNINPFQLLDDPKVVIDIGANVGMWAFWVAKRYPKARIYAVEPQQISIINLQAGAVENGFGNVTVIPCAVSSKPQLLTMWMQPSNSGAAGIFNAGFPNVVPSLAAAIPLNTLFEAIPEKEIDHMKVDIEGGEFQLFEGFKYWDRVKSLQVEIHPWPQFQSRLIAEEEVRKFKKAIYAATLGKRVNIIGHVVEEHYK